ncbi:hypothetical protein JHK84_050495 [Glycine max]|nr:hypothetical protein JHK85_051293 [Glycine max]KAG5094907.1 hypothetical protein JHK84_050495 [Glycine max]
MGWKRIENGLRKVTKDEGGSLKKRVQEMKEKAHKVVQEGGSSYDTYYDAKVLHASEDRIGKMVRVDQNTLTQERGKYVHLCVKVNLTKAFLALFELNQCYYKIEYEACIYFALGVVGLVCGGMS